MVVRPRMISVMGAECTGKTLLCTELAHRLPAICVPEYLRDWCDRQGRTPSAAEQRDITAAQLAGEQRAARAAIASGCDWIVLDSSPLLTAIYSLEYFDDDSLLADAMEHQRSYTLTVVTGTDIPWQADGLQRDGPARRDSAQRRLLTTLNQAGLEHVLIEGSVTERIAQVLALTRALQKAPKTL